jgi:probable phosphoglycerate mutase
VGPLVLDVDLRERHAGEWQGLTRTDIERDWPGYLGPPAPIEGSAEHRAAGGVTQEAGPRRRPPGWEADDDLLERAVRALQRIHGLAPGGEAIAVTHGGLVYALEASLGAPFVRLPNLGGRWVDVGPEGPTRLGERVVLVDPDELTVPQQL